MLSSEKKYVDRSGSSVDFTLVEKAEIASYLCTQLSQNKIGIVDNFFRVLTSVRGFTLEVIGEVVKHNNFQICKSCLTLLVEDPSNSFDIVVFFCEAILRVISLNAPLQELFVGVLATSIAPMYSLLSAATQSSSTPLPAPALAHTSAAGTTETSTTTTTISIGADPSTASVKAPSKAHLHAILLLIDGILRRNIIPASSSEIPNLLKPIILDCLKVFFHVKFGNVLHFTIVGIIVTCFEQRYKDLIDILIKEGKLIDKILEFSDKKSDTSVGYYGHIMLIAKYINECPLATEYLVESENWQRLMETSVKDFLNRNICPPGADLLAAKQRQIAKAGGSFLG